MLENTGCDETVVSRHDARDVFDWFASIKANFFTTRVYGVTAKLNDSDFHTVPSSIRWLLKNEGSTFGCSVRLSEGSTKAGWITL